MIPARLLSVPGHSVALPSGSSLIFYVAETVSRFFALSKDTAEIILVFFSPEKFGIRSYDWSASPRPDDFDFDRMFSDVLESGQVQEADREAARAAVLSLPSLAPVMSVLLT